MIVTDVDEIRVMETLLWSARYFFVSYEMIAIIHREGFIAIFSFSTEYQYHKRNRQVSNIGTGPSQVVIFGELVKFDGLLSSRGIAEY